MKVFNHDAGFITQVARVSGILFALFISIFSLDVFSAGYDFMKTILALLIHLAPAFFIVFILLISWKREWIGGIVYTILGVLYLVFEWNKFDWMAYVFISGPLFFLGILYFISWGQRKKNHITSPSKS